MQAKTFVLQIHADDSVTLITVDEAGRVLEKQVVRDFSAIGNNQRPFIVLIPGQHVLMSVVKLPNTSRRELMKAIPFAVEEQVASDIEKLHFVLGEKEEQAQWTVAVINKEIFENYKQRLKSQQLSPLAILPDFLILPYVADEWTIVIDQETALVRTGKFTGFSTEVSNLTLLLQVILDHSPPKIPKQITLYGKNNPLIKNFSAIQTRIPVNRRDKNEMTYAVSKLPFNLLPTQYRQRDDHKIKRYWRLATYVGIVWIFLLFSSMFTQWLYWNQRSERLQQQISSTYRTLFPGGAIEGDVRSRLQNEFNTLMKANQNNKFVRLLERSAEVLHRYPKITVESLTYQQDQLTFELTTDTLSELELFIRAMNQMGLQVKQNQTSNNEKKISTEITIK